MYEIVKNGLVASYARIGGSHESVFGEGVSFLHAKLHPPRP